MSNTEFPKWTHTLLGSEIALTMGQSPPSNTYNTERKGLPFFQGKADFGNKYPVATVWCDSPQKIAEKGSILFSVRAPVGEINLNLERSCIGRGLASITANKMSDKYLFYLLDFKKRDFQRLAQGSTFEAINGSEMKEVEVHLPPLKEQQKIAEILTSVDEVIENTQSQINKLEDLKKATMNELLTKGIGHTEFKETEIGRIPKSWSIKTVGEVSTVTKLAGFEYTNFIDYSVGGEIIALRALNLRKGELDLSDTRTIPRSVSESLPRSKLYTGDVLISYVGTIGLVAMVDRDGKYHLAPNVAKITVKKDALVPEYLLNFLTSDFGQKKITDLTTVTSQPSLNMENIRKIQIILPEKTEQLRISKSISAIKELGTQEQKKLINLKSIKKSLMQDLLTGKVRVTVN